MSPRIRRLIAAGHLVFSLAIGTGATLAIARDSYERLLMGVSFYAIALESVSVLANTDVRAQQEGGQ